MWWTISKTCLTPLHSVWPVLSQKLVFLWLLFVVVYHICFSFIILYIHKAVSYLVWNILHLFVISGLFIVDYAIWVLLIVESRWWPIIANFSDILSLMQSCLISNHATSSYFFYKRWNNSTNMFYVKCTAGSFYPFGAFEIIPSIRCVSCYLVFSFLWCVLCKCFFVCRSFPF